MRSLLHLGVKQAYNFHMKKITIDADVRRMTEVELQEEVMRLRTAFRKELEHTGNHRCWINLLQALPEGKSIAPLSLPEGVFLANCKRYFERNRPVKKRKNGQVAGD